MLGQKKYELTYHYVGDSNTHRAIQIGNSLIDAVNLTLADEKRRKQLLKLLVFATLMSISLFGIID